MRYPVGWDCAVGCKGGEARGERPEIKCEGMKGDTKEGTGVRREGAARLELECFLRGGAGKRDRAASWEGRGSSRGGEGRNGQRARMRGRNSGSLCTGEKCGVRCGTVGCCCRGVASEGAMLYASREEGER